jgi:hypothetical protein
MWDQMGQENHKIFKIIDLRIEKSSVEQVTRKSGHVTLLRSDWPIVSSYSVEGASEEEEVVEPGATRGGRLASMGAP